MTELNADASLIARGHGATSCTDITGFGFLGHAYQMAEASGVSMEIRVEKVPKLDGVLQYAAMGLLSGATYANRKYVGGAVEFDDGVKLAEQDLLFDPQTSGGLLVSCPQDRAQEMMARAQETLSTPCAIVGRILERTDGPRIRVRERA
jgi:selenide,water dikinase